MESALLMLAAYFLGAITGCLLRRLLTSPPRKDTGGDATTPPIDGTTTAAADAQLRESPEPVQPKIETVAEATPPQDAEIAESARFERVLTNAPAGTETQEATEASAEEGTSGATAAAAIAAGAAAATALATSSNQEPRYPAAGGTGGASGVAAPIAEAEPGAPADDLRHIDGLDATSAGTLNQLGYTRFAQIADWKPDDITRVKEAFGDNRATAGGWAEQAKMLADGKETAHIRQQNGRGVANPWLALAAAGGAVAATAAATTTAAPEKKELPIDLLFIEGIDDTTKATLKAYGITNYKQIAFWKKEDVAQIEAAFGEPGRVSRENWIEQARLLDSGTPTTYAANKTSAVAVPAPTVGLPAPEPLPATQAPSATAESSGPAAGLAATAAAGAVAAAAAATAAVASAAPAASDDLKRINGIDAATESRLNENGIQSYAQIAAWTAGDVEKTDTLFNQPGRVSRENWIEQAKMLGDGKETAFTSERPANWPASDGTAVVAPVAAAVGDDLTRITGIDSSIQDMLQSKGVTSYAQIANWTPAHVDKVDNILGTPGRVAQENWISQAQALAGIEPTPAAPAPSDGVASTATAAAAAATAASVAATTLPDADDLKRINGISADVETMLNSKGVKNYTQIARWSAAHVNKVDSLLEDPGRVVREKWIEQAKLLAAGQDPSAALTPAPAQQQATPASGDTSPPTSHPARLADAIRENNPDPAAASHVAGMRSVRSQLLSGSNQAPDEVDDLKKVRGIGVLIEKKLNAMGVFSYEQIANWSAGDVERVSSALDFKGRIEREGWIQQARILASGGQTEFSKRL